MNAMWFKRALLAVLADCFCPQLFGGTFAISSPFMEAAIILACVDGREFEMLRILIFVSGMFVGGILLKLCCRSVQVVIDSRNQRAMAVDESIGKKRTRDVSVEVNEVIPSVFADWIDVHGSYYRTEKGTVLRLTSYCIYAKKAVFCLAFICARSV